MPSNMNDRTLRIGLAVLSVLVLAYSLVIVQQILLGVLAVATLWALYLFYHLIKALARIATAIERLAAERADGDRAERTDRDAADAAHDRSHE